LQPYCGVLADYTSAGKRDNVFAAQVARDILGTYGLAWDFKADKLFVKAEAAHNFGKAESADPEYKDITHAGYMAFAEMDYSLGKVRPSAKILLCSGNQVNLDMVENQDTALVSAKNRAFSYLSPSNRNLGYSISGSNSDMRPLVAMGNGYGLNYGIPRPKTFYDTDFDNLLMPCIGFDIDVTKPLRVGVYEYYIRSFQKGVGTFEGEARHLSAELGYETDIFVDYQINEHLLVSASGGYFAPGRFYKERRDDDSGSLLTPFVRGDGSVDPAYQIELSLEVIF
jgi:hypothetical protein